MEEQKEKKSLRILVIDDSPAQLEVARRLLADHEVTTASGWAETKGLLMSGMRGRLLDYHGPINYKERSEREWFDNPDGFDVVLTDMMMPGENAGLNQLLDCSGKQYPYGFNIAMLALRCGVKKVAVVSNGHGEYGNHHSHPILWACDELNDFNFGGRLMFFTGYWCPHVENPNSNHYREDWYLKDWAAVLEKLLA